MQTVFSHIVSNRLSQEYENIATESLAFILQHSDSARNGMMRLLRSITPDIPNLHFRTQQTEILNQRNIRPDMLGYDEIGTHVYIENKFEAGLTDNQPKSYIERLAKCAQPTILLVVVPELRQETMWGELNRRLIAAGISGINQPSQSGNIIYSLKTEQGPKLALTSWSRLLSLLEDEVTNDQAAKNDLLQLRSLCEAADRDTYIPISTEVISDQRTPAYILQLYSIVLTSTDKAMNEGILNTSGTLPQANFERIGRYANVSTRRDVGFWFGIHFRLWKVYGRTPLWLVFSDTQWGRSHEVWPLIVPMAEKDGIFTKLANDEFIIAIDIPPGAEKDAVVRYVVDRLKWVADVLNSLPQKPVKSELNV